jgi:ferrous-iron efflux pump FieF
MAIIVLVSYFISKLQSIAIKSSESVALKADHAHYATDSYLNAAVLIVIILDAVGIAPLWFDPLVGIIVAGIFIKTAYNIAQSAIDYLMDKEVEGDVREKIIELINKTDGILSYHDLRITGMISNLFISLDIEVEPNITITEAHEIARSLEHRLIEAYSGVQVFIHIDPEGDTDDTRH